LQIAEEDVLLQFDAIGDQLSAWVWGIDEEMPRQPLLTATYRELSESAVTIFVNGGSSGYFRFIHVADIHIPEPSAVLLAAIALTLWTHTGSRAKRSSRLCVFVMDWFSSANSDIRYFSADC
jgi:hypothetical protein